MPKSKKTTKNKKVIKNKKQNNLKSIFFTFNIIILLVLAVFVIYSLIFKDNQVSVLSKTTSSVDYGVNEDELAMFATLAYETPSPRLEKSIDLNVGTKTITHKYFTHDGSDISQRTKCYGLAGETKINCLKSGYSNNKRYMYEPDDIVGIDYEFRLIEAIKQKGWPLASANAVQLAMTGLIQQEIGQDFYFSDLVDLAQTNRLDGWEIVDFREEKAFSKFENYGLMSAVTFKKDKNIVIAYRGTDLTDIVEWIGVNGSYALKNNTNQDEAAVAYAREIAEAYNGDGANGYNIYTTGHSLGGYLAQVAGASLLGSKSKSFPGQLNADNTLDNPYNLKRIVYFNGMGMFFSQKSLQNIANKQQDIANKLISFNINADGSIGDRVLLVRMHGDPVSAIGIHYGKIKTMNSSVELLKKHNNLISVANLRERLSKYYSSAYIDQIVNSKLWSVLTQDDVKLIIDEGLRPMMAMFNVNLALDEITEELNNKEAAGVKYKGLLPYFMTNHETDSFFNTNYYSQGSNVDSISSLSFDSDSEIKINKLNNNGPFCTFRSDYAPRESALKMDGRYYQVIYPNPDQAITGYITCFSTDGFSDDKISRSDIEYADNKVASNIVGIKINNSSVLNNVAGKQVVPGDNRVLYWDISITPTRSILTKSLRTGFVSLLGLREGAVNSQRGFSNNRTLYPYRVIIEDKASWPRRIGRISTLGLKDEVSSDEVSDCKFNIDYDIKTVWLFNPTYNGNISCVADDLTDSSIVSSDLTVDPSNRLTGLRVSYDNKTKLGTGRYKYSWSVSFRGVRSNPGGVSISLIDGAIKSSTNSINSKITSNTANVRK